MVFTKKQKHLGITTALSQNTPFVQKMYVIRSNFVKKMCEKQQNEPLSSFFCKKVW